MKDFKIATTQHKWQSVKKTHCPSRIQTLGSPVYKTDTTNMSQMEKSAILILFLKHLIQEVQKGIVEINSEFVNDRNKCWVKLSKQCEVWALFIYYCRHDFSFSKKQRKNKQEVVL